MPAGWARPSGSRPGLGDGIAYSVFDSNSPTGEPEYGYDLSNDLVISSQLTIQTDPTDQLDQFTTAILANRGTYWNWKTRTSLRCWGCRAVMITVAMIRFIELFGCRNHWVLFVQ